MDSSLAIIKKINTGHLDFFIYNYDFLYHNCEFISYNSVFFLTIASLYNRNYNSQFSELCEKNIFLFSVVEISFHRNPTKTGLILFSTGWLVALPCCIETNTKMKSQALHPMTCIHIDVFSFKEFLKPHESDWEWHAPPLQ